MGTTRSGHHAANPPYASLQKSTGERDFAIGPPAPSAASPAAEVTHSLGRTFSALAPGADVIQCDIDFYRGTKQADAGNLLKPKNRVAELGRLGGGELGAGKYFWKDDMAAGLLSALQYKAPKADWAVVKAVVPDETWTRHERAGEQRQEKWLDFSWNQTPLVEPKEWEGNVEGQVPEEQLPREMDVKTFRAMNKYPEKYGLGDAQRGKLDWTKYPVIVGESAAQDYGNQDLFQASFSGNGLALLSDNDVDWSLAMQGKQITDEKELNRVKQYKLSDRFWVLKLKQYQACIV